jgi:SHS2 domain-containing protein
VPYSWLDHTGEVELSIEAESEREIFALGLEALGELLADEPGGEPIRRRVSLASADRATLLADWLGELVYLAETEGFLPERLEELALDGTSLRATFAGRAARPRNLVKAVTYHGLELSPAEGGWRARIVLDV